MLRVGGVLSILRDSTPYRIQPGTVLVVQEIVFQDDPESQRPTVIPVLCFQGSPVFMRLRHPNHLLREVISLYPGFGYLESQVMRVRVLTPIPIELPDMPCSVDRLAAIYPETRYMTIVRGSNGTILRLGTGWVWADAPRFIIRIIR